MRPDIHIYATPQEVAEKFALFLREKVDKKEGLFHWALSGGSTPKILFEHLANTHKATFPWEKLCLYWGDERCAPPQHAESNYRMTYDTLLKHVGIPIAQIHRIKGENEPAAEAQRYGNVLHENIGGNIPSFDLIMLGMGADGHTASIFPQQLELLTATELCGVAQHPENGQFRVTLNGTVLNAAREVVFLVTGSGKAEKVHEIIGQTATAKQYPAAHINPINGRLHWFLDAAAAERLNA